MKLTNFHYALIVLTVILLVVALIFVILMSFEQNEDKRDIYMIVAIVFGAVGLICGAYTIYTIYSIYSIYIDNLSNDMDAVYDKQLKELQILFDLVMLSNVIISSSDKQRFEKIKTDMEFMIKHGGVGLSGLKIEKFLKEFNDYLSDRDEVPTGQFYEHTTKKIDDWRRTDDFIKNYFQSYLEHPIISSYMKWIQTDLAHTINDYMEREYQKMKQEELEWNKEEDRRKQREKEKKEKGISNLNSKKK